MSRHTVKAEAAGIVLMAAERDASAGEDTLTAFGSVTSYERSRKPRPRTTEVSHRVERPRHSLLGLGKELESPQPLKRDTPTPGVTICLGPADWRDRSGEKSAAEAYLGEGSLNAPPASGSTTGRPMKCGTEERKFSWTFPMDPPRNSEN